MVVAGAGPHFVAQVHAAAGEQAGINLPVGGEAGAGAVGAEGLGHRGNDAYFSRAVPVAVAVGDLAPVVAVRRLQRHLGVDAFDDLGGGDYLFPLPAIAVAHIHVFNEPDDVPRTFEVAGEVNHRVVVYAFLHDRVDFYRR